MMKKSVLTAFVLALSLVVLPIGAGLAAPAHQTDTLEGTVQAISIQLDPVTGVQTSVLVTVKDAAGAIQDVSLTLEQATALGLIVQDPATMLWTVNAAAICPPDSTTCTPVIFVGVECLHPVAWRSAFFATSANEIMLVRGRGGFRCHQSTI
jgi:hypothetical protein